MKHTVTMWRNCVSVSRAISAFRAVRTPSLIFSSPSLGRKQVNGPLVGRYTSSVTPDLEESKTTFSELGISPSLVRVLDMNGYVEPFPIQSKSLPLSLEGKNIIGRAVTGSGKTLAYALPIIQKLSDSGRRGVPQALIITPTRELCRQVIECVASLSPDLKCVALYGGSSYSSQESQLRRGADIICATPGRLNDQIKRGNLPLDHFKTIILDEADELLTPNFMMQIEDVLADTPPDKQMLLFSATMPPDVKRVIKQFMTDPVVIDLTSSSYLLPPSIKHKVLECRPYSNLQGIVLDLIRVNSPTRAIVFVPSKLQAGAFGTFLARNGVSTSALHGDMSQGMRESCLADFRSGATKVLVATDVAARGIDIPEIDFVIQVEPPPSGADYYIHRSGRTGRKGLPGTSIIILPYTNTSRDFLRELKAMVKVEFISRPSREQVISSSLDAAVQLVTSPKDEQLMSLALPHAEELMNGDGVKALASAILSIAGDLNATREEEEEEEEYGQRGRRFNRMDREYSRGARGSRSRWNSRGRDSDWSRGRDSDWSRGDDDWGSRDYSRGRRDGRQRRQGDWGNDRRSSSEKSDWERFQFF